MFYSDFLTAIFRENVQYLIVGGLAVNLHGIPRVTQDIDLIIAMTPKNILKINTILEGLGYIPRLPINPSDLIDNDKVDDWIKFRNLKAFSFYHKTDTYKEIDIVLVHPLKFNIAFNNKTIKEFNNIQIFLASIDDLIVMKTFSGRNQDQSDIKMLEKLKVFLKEEKE